MTLARTTMGGLLDWISPRKSIDDWAASQRAALNADVSMQRAVFISQIREVASEATTEAAVKLTIAAVFTSVFLFAVHRIATRRRAAT